MGDLPGRRALEAEGETHGFRVNKRLFFGGLIGAVVLIFVLSNRNRTPVSFLFFDANLPLWVVLAATALFGAAAGVLLAQRRQRRATRNR